MRLEAVVLTVGSSIALVVRHTQQQIQMLKISDEHMSMQLLHTASKKVLP